MPEPTLTDAAQAAQNAGLLTTEDAAWLANTGHGDAPVISSDDVKVFRDTYNDSQARDKFEALLRGKDARTVQYLIDSRNAAMVQGSLESLIAYRDAVNKTAVPEAAGTWDMAGAVMAQSARRFTYGLGAVVAAGAAPVEAIFEDGFENTTLFALSDAAMQRETEEAVVMNDISARNAATGGNRFQMLLGQVLGQAPEMAVSAIGGAVAVKSAIRMAIGEEVAKQAARKFTLTAAAGTGMELSPSAIKAATKGISFLQGVQEGTSTLMSRAREADAEGGDVFTSRDFAAALASAAFVYTTEMLGGLTGEYRLLGGKPKASAVVDFSTQVAQESAQEAFNSIVGDIADGKAINWSEAGWGALGGAIGGSIFGSTTLLTLARSTPGPQSAQVAAVAGAVEKLGSAIQVEANASGLATRMQNVQAAPIAAQVNTKKLVEVLDAASDTALYQHFDEAGFAKVAAAKGMTPDALMAYWGAKKDAGIITVKESVILATGVKDKPEVQGVIIENAKRTPDAPTTTDIAAAWEDMNKLAQAIDKPTLPDGTADDSLELEQEITKEIIAADVAAGSKRSAAMAKREGIVNAIMARTAAIEWNKHYAAQGKTERVTPKQLWQKHRAMITGETSASGEQLSQTNSVEGWSVIEPTPVEETLQQLVVPPSDYVVTAIDAISKAIGVKITLHTDAKKFLGLHNGSSAIIKGFYSTSTGEIHVLATNSPVRTAFHEAGHAVLRSMPQADQDAILARVAEVLPQNKFNDIVDKWGFGAWMMADAKAASDRAYEEALAQAAVVMAMERPDFVLNNIADDASRPAFVKWYEKMADRISAIIKKLIGVPQAKNPRSKIVDIVQEMFQKRIDIVKAAGIEKSSNDKRNAVYADKRFISLMAEKGIDVFSQEERDLADKVLSGEVTLKQGDASRGAYDWNKSIIRIGKAANASTVHHELMHHWLEVTRTWAQDPDAPEIYRQNMADLGSWITGNAAAVSRAYKKVTKTKDNPEGKDVSADDIKAAAANMAGINLNTDVGKAIHEAVSYAYEEYLANGKAPTKELQPVFRQIRNWFSGIMRWLRRYTTAAGEPLLTEQTSRVFDRMLAAEDRAAQTHVSPEALVKLGVPPELVAALDSIYGDQLDKAAGEAYERIKAKVEKQHDRDMRAARELARDEVMNRPVYSAMELMKDKKMDAEALAIVLAGTELAGANMAAFTTKNGVNPEELAHAAGYDTVGEMVQDLLIAKPVEDAIAERADGIIAELDSPTREEAIAAAVSGPNSKLAVLAAEVKVLRNAVNAAKGMKKEIEKTAEAEKQEAVASVKAASKEEIRAKMQQIAEKAKIDKEAASEAVARFINWVRSDSGGAAALEAEKRLASEPMSTTEIANATDKASRKAVKLAAKGDYSGALRASYEVEVLTEMQKMAASRSVASVKAAADAKLAAKAQELADTKNATRKQKSDVLAALRSASMVSKSAWEALAAERVARLPLADLRRGLWESRRKAAERRRAESAAKGDLPAVLKATEDMAYAVAMEAAVEKALADRNVSRTTIVDGVAPGEGGLQDLLNGGLYVVKKDNVPIRTCQSLAEAEKVMANAGSNTSMGRSTDLAGPAISIRGLLDKRTQPESATDLLKLVNTKGEGYTNLTPGFLEMIHLGRTDPQEWTLDEWDTAATQIKQLHLTAKDRPSVEKVYDADQAAGTAAIPDNAVPPKQDSERNAFSYYGNLMFATMVNPRTLVQKLGEFGRKFFVEDLNVIETRMKDYQRIATQMMEKAYTFTAAERRALDAEIRTKEGLVTTRMQNLGRLLQWGTETGRQRVIQDLHARIKKLNLPDPPFNEPVGEETLTAEDRERVMRAERLKRDTQLVNDFVKGIFNGLTEKEINLIQTIWKTNDQIYEWDKASARLSGVALGKPEAHVGFDVVTDSGKLVRLPGGFATIVYDGQMRQIDLMTGAGVNEATVDLGFTHSRVEMVTGKQLDLTLEAQHREQMARIRTAAMLPYAKRFHKLMTPGSEFVMKAQEKMGEDWLRDVTAHVSFVFNGYDRKGIDPVIGVLHRAQTFAVFGGNMLTAAKQSLGVVVSASHKDVDPKSLIISSVDMMFNTRKMIRRVSEKSMMISQRREGVDVDTSAPEERIGNKSLFRKYERLATWPMRMVQSMVDVVTWDAVHRSAYAKALEKGMSQEDAAYEARLAADRAVIETQGSSMRSEAARINQSQIGVCITFAGKWMINNSNWLVRLYRGGDKAMFTKAVLGSVVLSCVAMTAAGALLQPEQDDEKQRDLQDYAIKAGMDMVAQPHYMGRLISESIGVFLTDAPLTGRSQGGFITTGKMVGQGWSQMINTMRGGVESNEWGRFLSGSLKASSMFPGVPAVQLQRSISAVEDDWDSNFEAFVAAFFGRDRTAMIK